STCSTQPVAKARVLSVQDTLPGEGLALALEQARLSACVLAEQALQRLGLRVASGAKAPARQSGAKAPARHSPGLKPAFSPCRIRFQERDLPSHRSKPGFQPASLPSKRFSAWGLRLCRASASALGACVLAEQAL